MREIKETLYFDEGGIKDLSEQVGLWKPTNFSKEMAESRDRYNDLKPKVSLGILSKLFGGPEISIEGDYHRGNSRNEKIRAEFVVSKHDLLNYVINKLGDVVVLRMTLETAWHLALAKEGGIFFIVNDSFRTIPTAEPDTWIDIANRSQVLQLTDASTCQFTLGMSLTNIVGFRDACVNPTSHLAVRLGQRESRAVSLTIFGKMDKSRYIKPFVVSWN